MPEKALGRNLNASVDPNDRFGVPRKLVKGGSFFCADRYCLPYRPPVRRAQNINTGMSLVGFRVAR